MVTGASRGIGRAVALGLARRGFDVVVTDIESQAAQLDGTAREIEGLGRRAVALTADVRDRQAVGAMVAAAIDATGRIDALVNNAGILSWGEVEGLSETQWDDVLDVNAKGVFLVTQAVLPHMKERRYGRIVSIGSIAAKRGAPGASHYCASKAAVLGFTRAVAAEGGAFGITANGICPGIIVTEMGRDNVKDQRSIDYWVERTYLARLGDPEDVVGPVCFFASDESAFVTGQTLNVCGGIIYD